jgi:hypothetical protein
MVRLSLLGVFNINQLTECTKVLPAKTPGFQFPDQQQIDQWLKGGFGQLGSKFGELVATAQTLTNSTLQQQGVDPKAAASMTTLPPQVTPAPSGAGPVAVPTTVVPVIPSAAAKRAILQGTV